MKKTGDGRRIQRVEREVLQVLSRFLMGTFKGELPGIVTITRVQMPADLRNARVWISVLNGTDAEQKEAVDILQQRSYEMQRYLGDELQMRYTPKLSFQTDTSLDKVLKVDRILHELSKEKSSSDNTEEEDD